MYRNGLSVHQSKSHRENVGSRSKNGSAASAKREPSPERLLPCEHCGMEYSSKSIKRHMREIHPKEFFSTNKKLEFECSACNEKLGSAISE